ncbi:MAG: stage II sporulation protein D [Lawsonibacter sp.]|nr:stage II sporulation protein D [Lawsonibacter sp.]
MGVREEKRKHPLGPGVRQAVAAALALTVLLFLLPLLTLQEAPLYQGEESPPLQEEEPTLPIQRAAQAASARDKGRVVRLLDKEGEVVSLTMAEYLWGVVAAEMPASFQEEALKAQACAARTYTVIQQSSQKHSDADICADSHCCQAYISRETAEARWGLNAGEYGEKIERAVAETDGLGILYQGEPIQALFFSSAAGRTVDAVEVWGRSVDYLKSVDSPEGEEVPNYHSQVQLTAEEVRRLTLDAWPGADLSGSPKTWFQDVQRSESGVVTSLSLGGVSLTGGQVRSLLSLRSAAFSVEWDGEQFCFDVTGYGHGVGMSQYGANSMAKEGKTFQEILTWYYTNTQVDHLW